MSEQSDEMMRFLGGIEKVLDDIQGTTDGLIFMRISDAGVMPGKAGREVDVNGLNAGAVDICAAIGTLINMLRQSDGLTETGKALLDKVEATWAETFQRSPAVKIHREAGHG